MTSITQDGAVEFRFYRPAASSVAIVGEFNQWQQDDLAMEPTGDGWWTAIVDLKPGEYRFRYLADGEWHTDYAANGVERSKWGWNSILLVAATAPANAAAGTHAHESPLKIAA